MLENKSYLSYLPEYLREITEFEEIGKAFDPITGAMCENNEELLNEVYVETAESYGLDRLESILGIENQGGTVEIRRKEILSRLKGEIPYTFTSVYNKLISICGSGNVTMAYGSEPYTLNVNLSVEASDFMDIVTEYLKAVVPANIYIYCNIIYNTHKDLSVYTHKYLHNFKNDFLKKGVIE